MTSPSGFKTRSGFQFVAMLPASISLKAEWRFALEAVDRAARLARRIQAEEASHRLTKKDQSPVTVADFAVQAIVARLLQISFPTSTLVAEEDSSILGRPQNRPLLQRLTSLVREIFPEAGEREVRHWIDCGSGQPGTRFWTLDPIDGTKGFLRGEQFAVALSLIEEGKVQLGILGCPNLNDGKGQAPGLLTGALRGEGCWERPLGKFTPGRRLTVSARRRANQLRLLRSFESSHTDINQMARFTELVGLEVPPLLMDSQAKYAALAAGRGELVVRFLSPTQPNYRERIWDQAAGSLVVEEAGGKITDLDGRQLDFGKGLTLSDNRGVLASNGAVHQSALEALGQIAISDPSPRDRTR